MKEYKKPIDHKTLLGILTYLPNTGLFIYNDTKKIAGCYHCGGYIQIILFNKSYLAHRLAWFYYHGTWPEYNIDHINGDKTDNRIINLRDCTQRQNCQNKKIHRDGKLTGASYYKKMHKWASLVKHNEKSMCLGFFDTELEAHDSYISYLAQNGIKSIGDNS